MAWYGFGVGAVHNAVGKVDTSLLKSCHGRTRRYYFLQCCHNLNPYHVLLSSYYNPINLDQKISLSSPNFLFDNMGGHGDGYGAICDGYGYGIICDGDKYISVSGVNSNEDKS